MIIKSSVLLLGLLAGCAMPTPSPSTSPTPNGLVSISENDNGTTINVGVGTTINLTLHNTYWQIASSSDSAVLKQIGQVQPGLGNSCPAIPGTGCGILTAAFLAVGSGTATISASRRTCGEALMCAPEQQSYQVTVHVS